MHRLANRGSGTSMYGPLRATNRFAMHVVLCTENLIASGAAAGSLSRRMPTPVLAHGMCEQFGHAIVGAEVASGARFRDSIQLKASGPWASEGLLMGAIHAMTSAGVKLPRA
eukprot:Opistho-2@63389